MAQARFYLDEHVHPEIAARLVKSGHDVLTTQAANMTGAEDPDQLEFAASQNRVFYTQDTDFLVLASQWVNNGRDHAGIMWSARAQSGEAHAWIIAALELNPDLHNVTLCLPIAG